MSKSIAAPLAELALQLIDDAKTAEPAERLDIFKALTQYRVGTTRVDKKEKEVSPHANFAGFKKQIAASRE